MVGKIYPGTLMKRVRRVTEGLIDDEQAGFRSGRGCVDQIFTLKQTDKKAQEKKRRVLWTWKRGTIRLIGRPYDRCYKIPG